MFKIAAVFSDNMVLQREKNITIWGEADTGTVVTVSIGENIAKCVTKDGKWTAILPPMNAGGPYDVKITCECECSVEEKIFTNVMLGEVWLCGGQSNMEMEIHTADGGEELLKTLTSDMPIRYYYTNKVATVEQAIEAEKTAGWGLCGEQSSRAWSAAGFYFARKLAADLGVTVGLIGCNWGGTSASAWMDRGTLMSNVQTSSYMDTYNETTAGKTYEQQKQEYAEYEAYDKAWNERAQEVYKDDPKASWDKVQEIVGKNIWPGPINSFNPYRPNGLFETMVMRVCPYTLRGFLYYQGESDDHKPDMYYTLLTNLINNWRTIWHDDELPFIMVQLPMFMHANDTDYKHWCTIREAQMKAFKTVKNTGIAVILDRGKYGDIHPTDKVPVGERLCLQAEKLVYGMDVKAFGPLYKSFVYKDDGMELSFEYAENGFVVDGEPIGFEIAGEDEVFHTADVKINGDKIFVSSNKVKEPVCARYQWFNYAQVKIFNETGIPMAPFKTH